MIDKKLQDTDKNIRREENEEVVSFSSYPLFTSNAIEEKKVTEIPLEINQNEKRAAERKETKVPQVNESKQNTSQKIADKKWKKLFFNSFIINQIIYSFLNILKPLEAV